MLGAALLATLLLGGISGPALAESIELYSEDFEDQEGWTWDSDWRFTSSSACLPNDLGYISPNTALSFAFGSTCAYRENRLGHAAMTDDVVIPITTPQVTLYWWDFVGAEAGADFYYIQVSTDGGQTWPHEIYRDSQDETFWDREEVDLSQFVGQTIRLRFGFSSDATVQNYGWYIDDILIVGEELEAGTSALAIRDASLAEGEAGLSIMNFVLEVDPPNPEPITVERFTVNGTAEAGLDFYAVSGAITIPASTSSVTVPVDIIGDPFFEDDETFTLTLQNASENAHITIGSAVGTIVDDEQVTHLYRENFEPRTGSLPWSVNFEGSAPGSGLWHLADDTLCLRDEDPYVSAVHSMAFFREADCGYHDAAGATGVVSLVNPVTIPAEALNAQLSFHDYLEIFYDGQQTDRTAVYVDVKQFGTSDPWQNLMTVTPGEPSLSNIVYPWTLHTYGLDEFIGKAIVVRFRFEQPAGEASHNALGWLIDDFKISYGAPSPKAYTVYVHDASANEGSNGTTTMLNFQVDILPPTVFDGPTVLQDISVGFQTSDLAVGDVITVPDPAIPNATVDLVVGVEDIAIADDDYLVQVGQVDIPAGDTSAEIGILMASEDAPEQDEYFKLLLSSVSPMVHLVHREALGTLVNDDDASILGVSLENGLSGTELEEGVGTAQFTISLNPMRSVPITVDFETVDGTAVSGPGLDFQATQGSVTFQPNTTEATFEVIIHEDAFYEDTTGTPPPELPAQDRGRETFEILLTSDSEYAAAPVSTVFSIRDNDPLVDVPILDVLDFPMAREGSCPTISAEAPCDSFHTARFFVSLNRPNPEEIVVQYKTVSGTAVAGEDFEDTTGALTFPASAVAQDAVIEVNILADRAIEGEESFRLVVFDPTDNVLVNDNSGTATIFDDDYARTAFGIDGVVTPQEVVRMPLEGDPPDPYVISTPLNATALDFPGYQFERLLGFESTALASNLLDVDLVSGVVTKTMLVPSDGGLWSGFAWGHAAGQPYATTDLGSIYTVDVDAGTAAQQGVTTGLNLAALAVHPTSGRLYALEVNIADNKVYLHIFTPGEWTSAGAIEITGVLPGSDRALDAYWDCDFDDTNGDLYINARQDTDYALYRLNVEDIAPGGAATPDLILASRLESSLALATPPAPRAVQWTGDLNYADTDPSGVQVAGDASAGTGLHVSGVGDVNGDSFEDVAVTAMDANTADSSQAGKVLIFFGGQVGNVADRLLDFVGQDVALPAGFLHGGNGIEIAGERDNMHLGTSVSGVGDVNGDRVGDFVVGYVESDGPGNLGSGGAYLVYGDANLPASFSSADIGGLGKLVPGVWLNGGVAPDLAGIAVSGAGDVNGDNLAEILVGAPGTATSPGAAYLVFGASAGIGVDGQVDLASMEPPTGIRILGETDGSNFGLSVSGGGDVNGDGLSDIVIGAPNADRDPASPAGDDGQVFIIFGHVDYADDDAPNPLDLSRLSDGNPPAVDHTLSFTTVMPETGRLSETVYPPRATPEELPGMLPGMRITGEKGNGVAPRFGATVAGMGDFNGDGRDDLIIGAPDYDGSADAAEAHQGRAYMLLGSETFDAEFDAADIGGDVNGLVITGMESNEELTVAGAGDVNGDGFMDALLGAPDAFSGDFSGRCYVVHGAAGLKGRLSLRDLAAGGLGGYYQNTLGDTNFTFGAAVSAAGDFSGDGIADLVVGRAGGAFLLLGQPDADQATYSSRMRSGISPLGDVDELEGDVTTVPGEDVYGNVGIIGNGAYLRPASGVAIQFTDGGRGPSRAEPSTQMVTIYRYPAPDLDVGDGGAEDDARWTPAGVHWKVETSREGFTQSNLEFHYRDEDVAGMDLQEVRVYYSKAQGSLTSTSHWSWLPFEHDPDRNVFTVERQHEKANAHDEVNGYYALVDADLVTTLGGVILSVGVTTENVSLSGPEVTPAGYAFWNDARKRLYAVREGQIVITWKDRSDKVVSEIQAINVWPDDDSPVFQPYIAGSPAVDLRNQEGYIEFLSAELVASDNTVIAGGDTPVEIGDRIQEWAAELTLTDNPDEIDQPDDPSVTGRSLIMLSDQASATNGDIYFQFIRTYKWDNPDLLVGGNASLEWPIGLEIDRGTDPQRYGALHGVDVGGPHMFYPNAPYLPWSVRYPGFLDRDQRQGTIVPVNTLDAGGDPFVLVYYEQGTQLLSGLTGQPVRHPETLAYLNFFAWPHASVEYTPVWPDDARQIVISRQDGSGELDPATYGVFHDIYYENTAGLPGYNPNEEHALIAPYGGSGEAVFALRDDLNAVDTSEPYVLMTYYDPREDDMAKVKVYSVIAETVDYPFGSWPHLDFPDDPYEGQVGAFIQPPYPLSLFAYSERNNSASPHVFEDRTGRHWAKSAGHTVNGSLIDPATATGFEEYDPADIVMEFYYPVMDGFYIPAGPGCSWGGNPPEVGDEIPWLGGCSWWGEGTADPVDVTYTVHWPPYEDVPRMKVGEILIDPKFGLPQINGQCSVDLLYQTSMAAYGKSSAVLMDPVQTRSVPLAGLPDDVATDLAGSEYTFSGLPPSMAFRFSYDDLNGLLKVKGILVEPGLGFPYVLLNVVTEEDLAALTALSTANDPDWLQAINDLYTLAREPVLSPTSSFEVTALSTGFAQGTGYVTLAMQDADACGSLPVSLEVIRVVPQLESGKAAVVTPACVFEEKLTLMHINDFSGHPEKYEFEWRYLPDVDGTIPDPPTDVAGDPWTAPPMNAPTSGMGVNTITISGPGLLTLTDNWYSVRYRDVYDASDPDDVDLPWSGEWSEWTEPAFAPGWIKRVVGEINPFTQRASGGGIEGAEASFASFQDGTVNTLVSMISQAGPRFSGNVALNCSDLDSLGLIELYETVLNRGRALSIDALSPVDHPLVNKALLLVASRVNDLYMLLGNEAYADALDPTIGFGTDDGAYGFQATAIHPFMNQTSSLLEEELCLLRGRDDTYAPGVQAYPLYNRLIWNFTNDMTGGEVAYALNYNIRDHDDDGDAGFITELDAKRLYPQGHGDAWGHYLRALKTYYTLLNHPFYTWGNRSEAFLVAGAAVTVDYIDEQKFAAAAAAKARTGAQIVDLAYRNQYVEGGDEHLLGYHDPDEERAWGFSEWASRAGQGAYLDWVVGNAILRARDPIPENEGILKIDRTTVPELREIPSAYMSIQTQADTADLGMNPLGLATNVVPFDISPTDIDDGVTHFEQIYSRALDSLANAATVFDHANGATQALRAQADAQIDFERTVLDQEKDFNARLIEIFGYPYSDDIGPGGSYETGYDGPDLIHYMIVEDSELRRTGPSPDDTISWPVQFASELTPGSINEAISADDLISTLLSELAPGETLDEYNLRGPSVAFTASVTGGRFGIVKDPSWIGTRRAPGEIQTAISNLLLQKARVDTAIDDYNGLIQEINDQYELLEARYELSDVTITTMESDRDTMIGVHAAILTLKAVAAALSLGAKISELVVDAASEGVPRVTGFIVGFSNGTIFDTLAPARGVVKGVAVAIKLLLETLADAAEIGVTGAEFALELVRANNAIDLQTATNDYEEKQELMGLRSLVRSEFPSRMAVLEEMEALDQASGEYLKVLADGIRTIERRQLFRQQVAADTQRSRYKDMAFRIFRNEALQKYRAQFDVAARYTYLAAKAYDYETTLLSSDPMAGQDVLTDVVRARQLGTIQDGQPVTGTGLANTLAVMGANFQVLSGQLGFNNPQVETNRFSLRRELFKVLEAGTSGDAAWRGILGQDYGIHGVGLAENLNSVPEFRQFAVPPADFGAVEPGIVIPFSTAVVEGENFFGQPLGGLESSYDSTNFATKIRSVGIWFSNYDFVGLSNTPRVYLIPVGIDRMRSPTGFTGRVRDFFVVDQVLPVPFPIGSNDLDDPNWIPMLDNPSGHFYTIRRHGRLRAFHDSGQFVEEETHRDSRLVGRSVWNTKWLLIIPGSTLHSDAELGLNRFIYGNDEGTEEEFSTGVSDIRIFFETYAYPRLKKK